jgi:hypothetical protein
MASGQEHNGHHGHAHHGPKTLPSVLTAPEAVAAWRTRLLMAAGLFAVLSIPFAFSHDGKNHLLRAYLMGFMLAFGLAGGGLALLMVQYVSGGKWGLLLRRPLEAMSRTMWLVAVLILPVLIFMKHLYQWALYPTFETTQNALKNGWIGAEQAMTANAKRAMLSPIPAIIQTVIVFGILLAMVYFLNKWSIERDADPLAGTQESFDKWRIKFENLSGIGIIIYVVLLTDGAIVWIKSLDVTWYSTIWGLQFLVGQGYAVLALSILSVILLSRWEPFKTILRTTEQHDLGKFLLAFVMLNIYFTFAEFLIIWSGNIPDEIPWYLNRIHGGWWYVCTADFVFHWVIPFCLLLSRDLKRNKTKMIYLTCFMLFARCVDMFWIIEPNFKDAAGNLVGEPLSVLAYITVPACVLALWGAYYLTELMKRPLVNLNDPHLEEILEPEHAH